MMHLELKVFERRELCRNINYDSGDKINYLKSRM